MLPVAALDAVPGLEVAANFENVSLRSAREIGTARRRHQSRSYPLLSGRLGQSQSPGNALNPNTALISRSATWYSYFVVLFDYDPRCFEKAPSAFEIREWECIAGYRVTSRLFWPCLAFGKGELVIGRRDVPLQIPSSLPL